MTPRRSRFWNLILTFAALSAAIPTPSLFAAGRPGRGGSYDGSSGSVRRDAPARTPCIGEAGEVLPIDNDRALELKETAPVGKPYRALIQGRVTQVFNGKCNSRGTCHDHFEIQLVGARGNAGPVEVIYNEDFGAMNSPRVGALITACGDFINANRQNGRYEPSPSGAIIHWVHKAPCMDHEHGYVIFEDEQKLYGFEEDRKARACRPGVDPRPL